MGVPDISMEVMGNAAVMEDDYASVDWYKKCTVKLPMTERTESLLTSVRSRHQH